MGAKPASGGYQLFGGAVSGHQAVISLAALENFDYHAKIAPECCNATNGGELTTSWDKWTPPSGYARNADGTVVHTGSGQVYTPLRDSAGNVRTNSAGDPIFNTQSGGTTAQTTLTKPAASGQVIELPNATKKGMGRSPWTQVSSDPRAVIKDVEANTGVAIPQAQRSELAIQIRQTNHRNPVSEKEYRRLQAEYRRGRPQMIKDWEANTGQAWPEGAQLHHIVPQRYGGPNVWWNAHPALPKQHQGGIHGSGSPTQGVFPTPVRKE